MAIARVQSARNKASPTSGRHFTRIQAVCTHERDRRYCRSEIVHEMPKPITVEHRSACVQTSFSYNYARHRAYRREFLFTSNSDPRLCGQEKSAKANGSERIGMSQHPSSSRNRSSFSIVSVVLVRSVHNALAPAPVAKCYKKAWCVQVVMN